MRCDMLRQYIYVSTARSLAAGDLQSILDACERNNADRNITGLLLYNGRNFLQLLEGDEADLKWVIQRIDADSRHSGVSRLEDIPVSERSCPDWKMRHIRLLEDIEGRRAALDKDIPQNLDPSLRRIILNFAALN